MIRILQTLGSFLFFILVQNVFAQELKFNQSETNFIENKGQIKNFSGQVANDVKFVLERAENKVFLHENSSISFQINIRKNAEKEIVTKTAKGPKAEPNLKPSLVEFYRMDMQLLGANPNPTILTEGKSADFINYFNHGVSKVHHYQKVIYENVYPDIDWIVYTTEKGMKYDFYLRPGADPALIKIKFNFQDSLYLNDLGQLVHSNPFVRFLEDKPKSFQDGKEIETSFVLNGEVLSFQLADYDTNKPLTIDPDRVWSTYYGGADLESGTACTTDPNGNVYLCGGTLSNTDISTAGSYQATYQLDDAYVVKFNSSGARLWATYFGGANYDEFQDIAADKNGNIYLCGSTSSTSGIAFSGFQTTPGGGNDGFLVKMDTSGLLIWSTYIGGNGLEGKLKCAVDSASNIYVVGETNSPNNIGNSGFQNAPGGTLDAFLFKFSSSGQLNWSTYFGASGQEFDNNVSIDRNNNILLVGATNSTDSIANSGYQASLGGLSDGYLAKFNSAGQILWSTYFGGDGDESINAVTTDELNKIYVCGSTNSTNTASFGIQNSPFGQYDAFISIYDANGTLLNAKLFGGSGYDHAYDITTEHGTIFIAGNTGSPDMFCNGFSCFWNGNQPEGFVANFKMNLDLKWASYLGGGAEDMIYGLSMDPLKNLYVCGWTRSMSGVFLNGHQAIYGGNDDAFLTKIRTCNAEILGDTTYCSNTSPMTLSAASANSYLWSTGETTATIAVSPAAFAIYSLTVTELNGCTDIDYHSIDVRNNPNLSGYIAIDTNANCIADLREPGIIGTMVSINNGNNNYFTNTINQLGFYQTALQRGSNTISAIAPNPYWQICNNTPVVINDSTCADYTINFAMSKNVNCPLLNVDIAVPILRKTRPSSYFVNYCNRGTVAANNAMVSVTVDTFLEVLSTSVPVVSQNGNIYTFNVGNPEPGDCGTFSIEVIVKLSAFSGQTHCTYVSASPDTICIPNLWNGAFIESSATCQNDTVFFTLRNKGADMPALLPYTIYMDSFVVNQGTFQLTQNASFVFAQAADSGKCYRIIAAQENGFPSLLGDSTTTFFIENCNTAVSSAISRGFGLQFENGNAAPNKAVDCTQNLSAYDPNDKRGQPVGYSTANLIYKDTKIDYTIRFQNTGNDTAFNVVVTDTLSPYFDISTIEMGAASHLYTWQIVDGNVLRVTFNNIMLPDSATNEPLSNGFFKFRIQQQNNNQLGILIENQVSIFFDFEPPVLTNKTQHRVGQDFEISLTNIEYTAGGNLHKIDIYPNPFKEETTISINGTDFENLKILITDLNGRIVLNENSNGNIFKIQRGNLTAGLYILRIFDKNKLIASGKIIAK